MIPHEQKAAQEFASGDGLRNYNLEQEATQGFCIRGALQFFQACVAPPPRVIGNELIKCAQGQ